MVLKHTKTAQPGRYRSSKPSEQHRTIMHVDLDCFFVAASIRGRPQYHGRPLCIAHSRQLDLISDSSSAEIASCSYEARAKGVRSGKNQLA